MDRSKHLAQWWGPNGCSTTTSAFEFCRRRRAEPVQFRTTVTFEELGEKTTRLTLHAVFPSAAERERVIKRYGADKGAGQTLSRLAGYVATLAA